MRRLLSVMLVLMLLLPVCGAQAAGLLPFTCEEQGYTTMIDPSWRTEWVEEDGMYYHLDGENNMPYVLAWVYAGDSRYTDSEAFLTEEIAELQDMYSPNGGVSVSQYGSFSLGGRPVGAADMQYYNSQGYKIWLLIVIDVRDDFTAIFHCRYFEESQRSDVLDALDDIDGYLQAGGEKNDAPPADVGNFLITDAVESNTVFGRCAAPAGYTVGAGTYICTYDQSAMNPCLALIAASRENGPEMYYWSARDYMSGVGEGSEAQDGMFNTDFQTPMLHYMTASEYCDYLLEYFTGQLNAYNISVEEINTFPELQDFLDAKAQEHLLAAAGELAGSFLTAERDEITLCYKSYSFSADGRDYRAAVYTGNEAVYFCMDGYARVEWLNWGVPFTYLLFCPAEDWAEGSAAFSLFVSNTTASDQFIRANRNMSDAIWAGIRSAHDVTDCSDIAARALQRETSTGDDYEDERFTDYIFDQNDYTLSDGSHVKVSTAYDYVYEGDNGTVYYSDSAFAQPGGATQLYPN